MFDVLIEFLIFISIPIIADIILFLIDEFQFRTNSHNARSFYKQIHENGFEIDLINSLINDDRTIIVNNHNDILHIKKRKSAHSQVIKMLTGKTIPLTNYFNQTYVELFSGNVKIDQYTINDTYATIYHKFEKKLDKIINSHDLSKSSCKRVSQHEAILHIVLFNKIKEYDIQVKSAVGPTSIDTTDCIQKIVKTSTDLVWSLTIDHHNKTCMIHEPVLKIET